MFSAVFFIPAASLILRLICDMCEVNAQLAAEGLSSLLPWQDAVFNAKHGASVFKCRLCLKHILFKYGRARACSTWQLTCSSCCTLTHKLTVISAREGCVQALPNVARRFVYQATSEASCNLAAFHHRLPQRFTATSRGGFYTAVKHPPDL